MPVGFILKRIARQPDDFFAAEHFQKLFFDCFLGPVRIPVQVWKAGVGGDDRAFSVNRDATTFGNEPGCKCLDASMIGHRSRKSRIAIKW